MLCLCKSLLANHSNDVEDYIFKDEHVEQSAFPLNTNTFCLRIFILTVHTQLTFFMLVPTLIKFKTDSFT